MQESDTRDHAEQQSCVINILASSSGGTGGESMVPWAFGLRPCNGAHNSFSSAFPSRFLWVCMGRVISWPIVGEGSVQLQSRGDGLPGLQRSGQCSRERPAIQGQEPERALELWRKCISEAMCRTVLQCTHHDSSVLVSRARSQSGQWGQRRQLAFVLRKRCRAMPDVATCIAAISACEKGQRPQQAFEMCRQCSAVTFCHA